MKRSPIVAVLIVVATCVTSRSTHAACTTGAVVGCNHGTYDRSSGSPDDATGSLAFSCTRYHIITRVTVSGNSPRIFNTPGTGTYTYTIYWDSGRTMPADSSNPKGAFIAVPGANSIPIFCRMTAAQASPPPGIYTNTVTFTLNTFRTQSTWSDTNTVTSPVASCSASIAGNLVFGAYDPIVANKTVALDRTATATVNCSNNAPYTVTVGQGTFPAGTSTDIAPVRQMANGANRLGYFIYQDSARTTVLGNTVGTGLVRIGSGSPQAVTMYGQIPAGLNGSPGSYTDTVIVTVTY
jgi:spore coat protein U-like protein